MKLTLGQTYWIERDGNGEVIEATVYGFGTSGKDWPVVLLKSRAGSKVVRDMRTGETMEVDCVSVSLAHSDARLEAIAPFPAFVNLVALTECFPSGTHITTERRHELGKAVVFDTPTWPGKL